jgi:nitroimidazol reductase NimA-like FMN-containing flavoprotein (pyridoxamine 5'-phosphate oxidase superfamily)
LIIDVVEGKNIRTLVKKCMDSTLYLSLGTSGSAGVWVSPVAFAYDKSLNMYFVSSPESHHMKNIAKDQRVSVAVYATKQSAEGSKVGVQLRGMAKLLEGREIESAYKVYFGRLPEWEDTDISYFKTRDCEWRFVRIEPKDLYYFDNGRFGENRQKVKV